VNVAEELCRQAVAVQPAAAHEGVAALGVDAPVELGRGELRRRQPAVSQDVAVGILFLALARRIAARLGVLVELRPVGLIRVDPVRIARFQHGQAGAPLGHVLEDHLLDAGRPAGTALPHRLSAPVVLEGHDHGLFAGGPVVELVRPGAVGLVVKDGLFGCRVGPVLPRRAVVVPIAVFDHPLLVHDAAHELIGRQGQEPGDGLIQVEGHGAGRVIGHHRGLDRLTDLHQVLRRQVLERILPREGCGEILGGGHGQVSTEERLVEDPLEAVDAALQHRTMEGVRDIVGLQRAAFVEGDALADVEYPRLAVVAHLPVSRQRGDELIKLFALEPGEPFVEVGLDGPAAGLVGPGGIQGLLFARAIDDHVGVRVLECG